ncbi:hypothetical protein ACPCKW_28395 [Streptomyces griseoincarnatus]
MPRPAPATPPASDAAQRPPGRRALGHPRAEGGIDPAADEDGRLPTGDLGTVDARGIATVTGREKELIITDGDRNVAPARIESRLRTHPPIAHAVAVGGQRPYVAALLVLGDGGRVGGHVGGAGGAGGKSGAGVTGDLGACGP